MSLILALALRVKSLALAFISDYVSLTPTLLFLHGLSVLAAIHMLFLRDPLVAAQNAEQTCRTRALCKMT